MSHNRIENNRRPISVPDLSAKYKLTELPDTLMLSPKFLFDWWSKVVDKFGAEVALEDHSPDFKLGRELWVASVFAVCKRLSSNREHWVSAVSDDPPDALVAYFDTDHIGANRQIYPLEVTTFDKHSSSIEEVIQKKLDMAYSETTRIVCYVTRPNHFDADLAALENYVSANNPHHYEVWLLNEFVPVDPDVKVPLKLSCLTRKEDYEIDLNKEAGVSNTGEAVLVPVARSINKTGKMDALGRIMLEFPSKI